MSNTKQGKLDAKFKGVAEAAPPADIFKFVNEGDVLQGAYVGREERKGKGDDIIESVVIEDAEGMLHALALNGALTHYFKPVKEGDAVKVRWMGKVEMSKPVAGNKYKNAYKFWHAPKDA